MSFWKKQFPDYIYDAKYEEIIGNPNNEIKNIINFCDLNWEEDFLQFHKNKHHKTLSTAQARKPIYKSSKNSYNCVIFFDSFK